MIQTVRTPLKTELVIIPCEAASSNTFLLVCQGAKQRHTLPTKPPYSYRPTLHKRQNKKGHSNFEPQKGRYASDPCFKDIGLSVVQFWSLWNSPFEIHFMGAKVPCQPSDRPALGTSQGTAPEEEAAAHRGDRHWFVVKAWQHGLPPTETAVLMKGNHGYSGWDIVSIFNQCTGMLRPQPEPEQQDHWHLSSLKSMASSHWTREVGWHNSHSSSCHASRHDISQAQGVAVDAFQCQEASMESWSAANWKRGPKIEMAWNGHDKMP